MSTLSVSTITGVTTLSGGGFDAVGTTANNANAQSIAAFNKANSEPLAQTAFTQANTVNTTVIAAFGVANTALPNSGGTLTGSLTFNKRYAVISTNATSNVINCQAGNYFTRIIPASETITFSSPPTTGNTYAMVLRIIGLGANTITWANTPKWPSGTAPTLTAGTTNTDILVFLTEDGGTTWRGMMSQKDSR